MARINQPAESAVRANMLVGSAADLRDRLPVPTRTDPLLPEALILEAPFDAHGSPLWEQGAFTPQSRASMLVARAVDPRPRDRILDLCAAPGAKTTHLAALTGDRADIVAVERHSGRADALRTTCRRMRAAGVTVEVADAGKPRPPDDQFDRVLVDPPCSGLGTLQSRPDLRWRVTPEGVQAVVAEQRRILDAAALAVRPGGVLVYSTCTLSPAENERQIERFLETHPDFEPLAPTPGPQRSASPDPEVDPGVGTVLDLGPWRHPGVPGALLLLPHRHGSDGFFIARLRRNDPPGPGR
jgi:16S rRNA (cytosine967-C5)-methyltransferase